MQTPENKKHWLILGPLFVVIGAALWGTETYFRVNLNTRFDPEVLVFHEHLFCILFTLPLLFFKLKGLRQIPLSSWIYLILSGSVGSAIGTTFFTMSLKELNFSVANVLLNFQPLISIFFASLLLREKLGKGFFIWAAAALACGMVIATDEFHFHDFKWSIGLLYISLTALTWGFSTVAGRGAMLHMPWQVAVPGRFIVGAITLVISLTLNGKFNGETLHWAEYSDTFVITNYVWLSFGAGVVPLYFYFKGLSRTSASVGGFCELTQTFSALVLTWGFMNSPLSLTQVAAGISLLFTVFMINVNYAKANNELAMTSHDNVK